MKTVNNRLFLLSALIAGLGFNLAGRVSAQTFTTLHGFATLTNSTNDDGAAPSAGLILSGNTLYGTASSGGCNGSGAVFAVNTDGSGFSNLYSFTARDNDNYTNSDGAYPQNSLVLAGNRLYGTTYSGGTNGSGTVFSINTDGSGFSNLYSFTALTNNANCDGAYPQDSLLLSGNTLYGTATYGGIYGCGTVFAINTDGSDFSNLYSFSFLNAVGEITNGDGAFPLGGLILSGDTLYGTASDGGSSGYGTVFALKMDGTGFTNLHSFGALRGFIPEYGGSAPANPLVLAGGTLYGTTGGNLYTVDFGTVFSVRTNGTDFTNLFSFTYGSDGLYPYAGLILSNSILYGVAIAGGNTEAGTVFALNTNGTGFATLYNFTDGSDGAFPYGGLVLSGNTLYGTAEIGGSSGNGTVFSLSFTPQLTITQSGANVVLTWPTNVDGFSFPGFTLQSTPNLSPAAWSPVSPASVVVNGQNTVTNCNTGAQQFYRLIQ